MIILNPFAGLSETIADLLRPPGVSLSGSHDLLGDAGAARVPLHPLVDIRRVVSLRCATERLYRSVLVRDTGSLSLETSSRPKIPYPTLSGVKIKFGNSFFRVFPLHKYEPMMKFLYVQTRVPPKFQVCSCIFFYFLYFLMVHLRKVDSSCFFFFLDVRIYGFSQDAARLEMLYTGVPSNWPIRISRTSSWNFVFAEYLQPTVYRCRYQFSYLKW